MVESPDALDTEPRDDTDPGDDHAVVAQLLGRAPQCDFEVVVRDTDGLPRVIRNAAFLDDGTPMPTRYWLVGAADRLAVSRLESTGAIARVAADVPEEAIADAHRRYADERDTGIADDHIGPRPSGGVGGTRRGLKCLHAHYAWYLAGGDDPVGAWVAEAIRRGEAAAP